MKDSIKNSIFSILNKMKNFKITAKTIYKGHFKVTYRGVQAIKCPFDYVIYQMIMFTLKPDLVIEIGCYKGGGALYIADIMNIIGKGEVHSIDIEDNADFLVKNHPRIKLFQNGYQNYNINNAEDYKNILIIEDASHNFEDSLKCLDKFHKLVSIGSYYIVEDGIVNNLGMRKKYNGGPQKAISQFLNKNINFQIDSSLCDMFGKNATFNINGYLKRIR
jgi:cephalosporin hydroxylase